jgi:hypothetical protein
LVAGKLAEIVSLYHGETLSAEELDTVRARVAVQVTAAARLHRFPLANDHEPIFTVRTAGPTA